MHSITITVTHIEILKYVLVFKLNIYQELLISRLKNSFRVELISFCMSKTTWYSDHMH